MATGDDHRDVNPYALTHVDARGCERRLNALVFLGGLASNVVTLLAVQALRGRGFDPMLWFINHVIPAGALVTGLAAGSGYGVAIFRGNVRLRRRSMLLIAVIQVAPWAFLYLGDWLQWRAATGRADVGFLAWFDAMTRGLGWNEEHGDAVGGAFGAWGYLVRLAELVGFSGGALVIAAALRAHPYCDACRRYLRGRQVLRVPAGAPHRAFVRQKTLDAANAPARDRALAALAPLDAAVTSRDAAGVVAALAGLRALGRVPRTAHQWLTIHRHRCPGCGQGSVTITDTDMAARRSTVLVRDRLPAEIVNAFDIR